MAGSTPGATRDADAGAAADRASEALAQLVAPGCTGAVAVDRAPAMPALDLQRDAAGRRRPARPCPRPRCAARAHVELAVAHADLRLVCGPRGRCRWASSFRSGRAQPRRRPLVNGEAERAGSSRAREIRGLMETSLGVRPGCLRGELTGSRPHRGRRHRKGRCHTRRASLPRLHRGFAPAKASPGPGKVVPPPGGTSCATVRRSNERSRIAAMRRIRDARHNRRSRWRRDGRVRMRDNPRVTNPDRLTGLDASFLALEEGGAHMHVGSVLAVRRRGARLRGVRRAARAPARPGPALPPEARLPAARAEPSGLGRRSALQPQLPRAPHRAARSPPASTSCGASPGACSPSGWTAPSRCGSSGWSTASATTASRSICKTHHCLVDGISGVDIATVLFDLEPDPPERRSRRSRGSRGPSRSRDRAARRRARGARRRRRSGSRARRPARDAIRGARSPRAPRRSAASPR